MKNYRQITTTLLLLSGALGASGCEPAGSTETAKAATTPPTKQFAGRVTDFACYKSTDCDHSHFCPGDGITVTPNAAGKYDFKHTRHETGAEYSAVLTYRNGSLRGDTEYDHHGTKEQHWLILVPSDTVAWKVAVCDRDPEEGDSCPSEEGGAEQHAGYGHADD